MDDPHLDDDGEDEGEHDQVDGRDDCGKFVHLITVILHHDSSLILRNHILDDRLQCRNRLRNLVLRRYNLLINLTINQNLLLEISIHSRLNLLYDLGRGSQFPILILLLLNLILALLQEMAIILCMLQPIIEVLLVGLL